MGHALNKILKDMVNRTILMGGRRVDYRPGWDCHGLPIELRALQELRERVVKESSTSSQIGKKPAKESVREATEAAMRMGKMMSPVEIRSVAKDLAERTVGRQMEGFKWWGVMADWEGRWRTMGTDVAVDCFLLCVRDWGEWFANLCVGKIRSMRLGNYKSFWPC